MSKRRAFGWLLTLFGFVVILFASYSLLSFGGFGISSVPLTPTPTLRPTAVAPTITPTPLLISLPTIDLNIGPCLCTDNIYDCSDFETQQEDQACHDHCYPIADDIHFLDGDDDGEVCVRLP